MLIKSLALSLPYLSDGHGFFHVGIESVTLLSCEYVENLDGAIALPCSDVLVVGIETNAESLLGRVTQSILVLNFDF